MKKKKFRQILAALLAGIIGISMVPIAATAATGEKLTGITVVGTNVQTYENNDASYGPAKVLDGIVGDAGNLWTSARNVSKGYVTFDMGASVTLEELRIWARPNFLDRYIKEYEIYVTDTAPTYSGTFGETPSGLPSSPSSTGTLPKCTSSNLYSTAVLPKGTSGRYVTIYYKNTYDNVWINLGEIEFFGTTEIVSNPKLTGITVAGTNIQTYNNNDASYGPSKMLDGIIGDAGNLWTSAVNVLSGHITFDMGNSVNLSEIIVWARPTNLDRCIKDYAIYVSDTAPTYSGTFGETPSGLPTAATSEGTLPMCTTSALYGTIALPEGTQGRYVTVYIKNTYSNHSINIGEIEFYAPAPVEEPMEPVEDTMWQVKNVKAAGTNIKIYGGSYGLDKLMDGTKADTNSLFHSANNIISGYITFDLGASVTLEEMLVYARPTNPERMIKDYALYIGDTVPTYAGTDGTVPTGLPAAVLEGTLEQATADDLVRTVELPEGTRGRYVTLHIKSCYNSNSINICEIEFFASGFAFGENKISGVTVVAENAKEYMSGSNVPYPATMVVDGIINDSSLWHGAKGCTSAYITFDLGSRKTLSKLVSYSRTTNLTRNIKNYQIWVSDTAPVYSGVDGEAPTGLAATPATTGVMAECTASVPYGTINMPEGVVGRYVTLYIQDLYEMTYAFTISEIEFYSTEVLSVSELEVDFESGCIKLPLFNGYRTSIYSSSNMDVVALDGAVDTVNGGSSDVVLKFTDSNGNVYFSKSFNVWVLGMRHRLATREQLQSITASSAEVSNPATYMLKGDLYSTGHGKYWSSAKGVKENEIILTLEETCDVVGVSFKSGKNATYFPDSIEVLTSSDNETWTSVLNKSGLSIAADGNYYDYYFELQEDIKYIKLLCTGDTEYTQIGKIRAMVTPVPEAADAAAEKMAVEQNETVMEFDNITEQFAIDIIESSNESVIAKDGTITLPDEATDVTLTVKVTNKLDTADTATVSRTVSVMTQAMLDVAKVAQDTDLIPFVDWNATEIILPEVPEGYSIKIVKSSHPDMVDLEGNITRSDSETVGVRLTFEIKNETTGAVANTKALLIPIYKTYVVPTMTQAEIEKIHQDYESMSYGVFVHYAPENWNGSQTMYRDGVAVENVNELADAFDVKQFAKDMHDFGAEYVILTAWHGDAVPLYPSMVNQRWRDERRSEDSTTPQSYSDRDVIGELLDALEPYGIDLHLYTAFHQPRSTDEESELVGGTSEQLVVNETSKKYYYEQYHELVERYGDRLAGIWMDGVLKGIAAGEEQEWFKNLCRSFNPAMILSINTGFNDGDVNLLSHYNFHDVSAWEVNKWVSYREFPVSRHQTASCLAAQYWWPRNPQAYTFEKQPAGEMFQYLVGLASISYEGGLAASTGIYAIEPEEHGKENDIWMNGMRDYLVGLNEDYIKPVEESVKNTSVGIAYPTTENATVNTMEWGVSTESRDRKNVYLHVFNAPESNTLSLPVPADGSVFDESAVIMNFDGTTTEGVSVTKTESGYDFTLPEGKSWDNVDTVIKLTRTGYDTAIETYTGDKVFYDQVLEGVEDGVIVVREIEGKEYYLTVGTNVSGSLTDDCYPVVDGVTQVHFFAKEYQPFHIYFGSYALYGAKAGISPNDPDDITKPNALRASDEGETVMAGLVNYKPSGTTYIASEGKVTFDGFTFKGNANLQIGLDATEDVVDKNIYVDIFNCRNSVEEDAYETAPSRAMFYSYTAESKNVNLKNNRFDGIRFADSSVSALFFIRNWKGTVEGNFFSMKNVETVDGVSLADKDIFQLQGYSYSQKDWSGEENVTIRDNYLEGRVSTTVEPRWYDKYKVHILDNTIVPTVDDKSLINIGVAGSAKIDGITKYYSNIDTADINISGNKVINPYALGLAFVNIYGTVTATAADQVADINNYKAGNIKITHNELDYGTVSGNAFAGTAVTGYDNLVFDITCNKYGETVNPVKKGLEGNFAELNVTDETAHKEVITVEDTAPTVTAEGVGHKECTFCGELIAENVVIPATGEAVIGEQTFATLEEALAAAKENEIIKLNTDVTVNYITVDPEITLDLNGHVLTADYVIGFKGSVIGGEGKLIVDKNKVALDSANGGFLPVYDEDGYIFVNVNLENRTAMISEKQFAFSPVFDAEAHEALLAGSAASGIKVVVRLNWEKADNYKAVQDFTYLDQMVKTVVESYDETKANYGEMFIAEFAGTEAAGAEGVTVSAVIISDTGVEIQSAVTEF